MNSMMLVIALLAGVFATHSAASLPHAAPSVEKIDQAGWSARKKQVRLANGVRLAYVELGDPKGEPLLLLHGYTDTSRSWSLMAPHLSRYRLLIPDQRGHGAAEAPECCYSVHVLAHDAGQFLDALGVNRAAVAGHSLGSMVAVTMAAEYPDRVSKLVLLGSTALVPVKRGDWLYDNVAALKSPLDPNSEFMREWHPAKQPMPVDPAFADAAMQEMLQVPLHVWRGAMREFASVPVGRHAADVKARVLILSGGKDPLFPREHHESLVKAFPGAEAHVFPELGHNLLWERPAELGTMMARFLAR